MEQLLLVVALALLVFPVWTIVRIRSLGRENNALAAKLAELEEQLAEQRSRQEGSTQTVTPAQVATPPPAVAAVSTAASPVPAPIAASTTSVPATGPKSLPVEAPPHIVAPTPAAVAATTPVRPLLSPVTPTPSVAPMPEAPSRRIDWEQFMGAKLFAWLGGFAAFLGVAFFVKYSFEHDLIPPEVRVALGFVFALALIVGGLKTPRPRYAVPAQTLIATGIVSLYAVTFACSSIYHFAFFGPTATFLLMCLITGAAFLLAVRLEAVVIAVLGLVGGFATPVILSSGEDHPVALFGYIALLNVGLIAVALHRRWAFLVPLGALGTVAMEIGWAAKFLAEGTIGTAQVVTIAFSGLFLGAYVIARRINYPAKPIFGSACSLPLVALAGHGVLLTFSSVSAHPGWWFVGIMLADACLLTLAWLEEEAKSLHLLAGTFAFSLLSAWTLSGLTSALLPWALGFYMGFAALHTTFPLLLVRRRPEAGPTWWSQLFPPLTLLLTMLPLFKLEAVSFLLWPAVLLIDAMAIGVALLTASLLSVAAVLILTLVVTAVWLLHVPVAAASGLGFVTIVGGFAVLFFGATLFLGKRLGAALDEEGRLGPLGNIRSQLPAMSALLPFLLLVMASVVLPQANPSPLFGLGLLLIILTLGLSVIMTLPWLPACALGGIVALEYAWHVNHFNLALPTTPLLWYLLFTAVFAGFPFAFRRRFAAATGPWAVAALAQAVQFPLVYDTIRHAWPNDYLGLLPAAFAITPLVSVWVVGRSSPTNKTARLNQLAWLGGVALLFITLIFPIQFSRQWLTLSWALEGAALLWLFHRVPHRGLQGTGLVLLLIAFARLALNPAVLSYHARSSTPLLNWYLYSYATVVAALALGARWFEPKESQVFGFNVRATLNTLATVLLFLLLNLEIADFFSRPGEPVLTFRFSGNFAQDMSYTIAWSLFALALLLVSMAKQIKAGRYAALALLGVALLKLFLHDLARLDALYRVGALFAVATVAIAASFAYQRMLPRHDDSSPRHE